MKETIVTWKEFIDIPDYAGQDAYEMINPSDLYNEYKGRVIGTNGSFWHGETLTVACDDGVVRTVYTRKVRVCD